MIEFWESYDDAAGTVDAEHTGGTITISYGTASDCNGNGVDDASELGPDTDRDMSGVLDEESLTDCDLNGVPDVCEGGEGVPNDLFENATPMDLNGQVIGNTECAGEEATFGDQCSTAAFTGDGPDVFYSISLVEAGTIDLWTCATSTTTPTCRSTTLMAPSSCATVIPATTKLRTAVCSIPHGSTLIWRLATTWCVLAAGKVQPAPSCWTAHSATCLIATATADLMMKTLLGASVKIAMAQ